MKVLIIGGTKFIGKAICEKLLSLGHTVTLFNRGQTSHSLDVETIRGDIEDIAIFREQLLEKSFDSVVHCIAFI